MAPHAIAIRGKVDVHVLKLTSLGLEMERMNTIFLPCFKVETDLRIIKNQHLFFSLSL